MVSISLLGLSHFPLAMQPLNSCRYCCQLCAFCSFCHRYCCSIWLQRTKTSVLSFYSAQCCMRERIYCALFACLCVRHARLCALLCALCMCMQRLSARDSGLYICTIVHPYHYAFNMHVWIIMVKLHVPQHYMIYSTLCY